jgi:hypothetical protein
MAVTSIALPNDFQLPAGTVAQPISTASSQANQARQVHPATAATPYQQLQSPQPQYQPAQFQQPTAPIQPANQQAQSQVSYGAAAVSPVPAIAGQAIQANGTVPRPTVAPINVPGILSPLNPGPMPPVRQPQYVGQPPMIQAAQPINVQPQMVAAPQQQPGAIPPQQIPAAPTQQIAPQQGQQQVYQQAPAANGVRTSVSYGPAPTAWR